VSDLAELLNFVITSLQTSSIVQATQIVENNLFSASKYAIKVRAQLSGEISLQIRLYQNEKHIDYAYQVYQGEQSLMRWDNKEHFSGIATHPHHFHHPHGQVEESPLQGDPFVDLPAVLEYLASR
jgi:predicted small secreted protein